MKRSELASARLGPPPADCPSVPPRMMRRPAAGPPAQTRSLCSRTSAGQHGVHDHAVGTASPRRTSTPRTSTTIWDSRRASGWSIARHGPGTADQVLDLRPNVSDRVSLATRQWLRPDYAPAVWRRRHLQHDSTDHFTAASSLRAYYADLEVAKRGEFCNWDLTASAGLRYGSLEQTYQAALRTGNGTPAGSLDFDHRLDGIGPTIAIETHRQLTDCLAAFANFRYSYLFGQQNVDFRGRRRTWTSSPPLPNHGEQLAGRCIVDQRDANRRRVDCGPHTTGPMFRTRCLRDPILDRRRQRQQPSPATSA